MTFAPAASHIRWLSFRNQSEEAIPPFAVLRPTGVITVHGQAVLTVSKPDTSGGLAHFFNGPFPVEVGGFGSCTADFPCYAAHDPSDQPALGDEWGPEAGSWQLVKANAGYQILGGAQDGRVQVTAARPTAALVHFYLNADLERGGSQTAQVLEWNGADWLPGASTIEVFDSSRIGPAQSTQLGASYYSAESQRYEIVTLEHSETNLVRFYLNTNLPQGGSASAQPMEWSGGVWSPTGGDPINVFDSSEIGPGEATDTGWAILSLLSGRHEVLTLRRRESGRLRWAKATTKWTNLPDNGSYVHCHRALDRDGTLELDDEEEPIAVTVYLPRPGGAVDPNVRADDVIGYLVEENAEAIAVTGYLDDSIGTVKMWVKGEEEIPGGWRIYSPSPGRFPVGVTTSDEDIPATTPGATGGDKKHTHEPWSTDEATVEVAPHTGIETQYTEIEVWPHAGYYTDPAYVTILPAGATTAYLSGETEEAGANINGSGTVPVQGTGSADTSAESLTTQSGGAGSGTASGTTASATTSISLQAVSGHTHQVNLTGGSAQAWSSGPAVGAFSPGHTTSDGGHNHTVTDPGHVHNFSGITVSIGSHTHSIDAHDHSILIADIAAGLTVNGSDIAEVLAVAPHAHAISELEVSIPAHTHETYPHFHAIPTMEHVVYPGSHNHGVDDLEHDVEDHDHEISSPPEAKHIPPFFGVHFIERYE